MPIDSVVSTQPLATKTSVPGQAPVNPDLNMAISNSFYKPNPFQLHPVIQNSTLLEVNNLQQLPPQLIEFDEDQLHANNGQPTIQPLQPRVQVKIPVLHETVRIQSRYSERSPLNNPEVRSVPKLQPLPPEPTNYPPLRLCPLHITLPLFDRDKANKSLQRFRNRTKPTIKLPTAPIVAAQGSSIDSNTVSSSVQEVSSEELTNSPLQAHRQLLQPNSGKTALTATALVPTVASSLLRG